MTPSSEPTSCVSLCLSKDGDARFLGHLDFARLLERSLRRSGLPVRHTRGFNPRFCLSFTDALPVGLASQGEWVAVKLTEDLDPETVRRRLSPAMPGIVRLVDVRAGPPPEDATTRRYRLEVEEHPGSASDALDELLQRDSVPATDPRRPGTYELRHHVAAGEVRDGAIEVDLVPVGGRCPRPDAVAAALAALAVQAGQPPPAFGIMTRLLDRRRRPGEDDTWEDDVAEAEAATVAVPRAAPVPPPASC